jgi:hypothetical protein
MAHVADRLPGGRRNDERGARDAENLRSTSSPKMSLIASLIAPGCRRLTSFPRSSRALLAPDRRPA